MFEKFLVALLFFFCITNLFIKELVQAQISPTYVREIDEIIQQKISDKKKHEYIVDNSANMSLLPTTIDFSKQRIRKLNAEIVLLQNKQKAYLNFMELAPSQKQKIYSEGLQEKSNEGFSSFLNDPRFKSEIESILNKTETVASTTAKPVTTIKPASKAVEKKQLSTEVKSDKTAVVVSRANKIQQKNIVDNISTKIQATGASLAKHTTELEGVRKDLSAVVELSDLGPITNRVNKISNEIDLTCMELISGKKNSGIIQKLTQPGLQDDENFKLATEQAGRCKELQSIVKERDKDVSSKKAELVQKQNMTDSEKCLAVDVRDRDEKGILPGKSKDDEKISEKNCVTASFYVGLCDDINLPNRSCLKRCGGFSFLNKGYSEDLSFSEISELVSEGDKNNPPAEEELNLSVNLTKIINEGSSPVVIDGAKKLPEYLSNNSECKKLFGCYRAISTSRNDENLKTLEKIASGLNHKAVKCDEIKRISQKLKDEKLNEMHERRKSFSQPIKSIDDIRKSISQDKKEGYCKDGGTIDQQKARIFKMRVNGHEEFIVPIQLSKQKSGDGNVLSFIDQDGKKQSMNIYHKDGIFYQEEPSSVFQDPDREYRTEIYEVHVSQMGGKYCDNYNVADKERKSQTTSESVPSPATKVVPQAK